ncbi:MAG: class I SAM-dependent methyltransferase [Chloroflexota bacterium]|nr:class I SAM-dependent methyltransferase [Chloroflexota bacterium]
METKIDLEWDDVHVLPSKIYPDVAFLFQRINDVVTKRVELDGEDVMLDIGCGRAVDAIQLAKRGGNCVGLDPSRKMVNYAKECITDSGVAVSLIQGIGESLPLKTGSLDEVICKGALDHFPHPAKAIEEIARVLKPQGEAIIVIANFESLGFRLGRWFFTIEKVLLRGRTKRRDVWQIPADHTYKFDYTTLKRLVKPYLKAKQCTGISLLFGLPGWSSLLDKLPQSVSLTILRALDKLAYHLPSLSDAILLECTYNNGLRIDSDTGKSSTS